MRRLPFPMILCDGCTAPCEAECKLCELGDGVSIREIERAIVRYGGTRADEVACSACGRRKRQRSLARIIPPVSAGELEKCILRPFTVRKKITRIYCGGSGTSLRGGP